MKKDLVLQSVQSSASSIFSKEDVINLINSIELESSRKISTEDIQRAIDNTISWVEHNEDELLDLDSAELEMDYQNRVRVVGLPLLIENLREALENNFSDFAQEEDDLFVEEVKELRELAKDLTK